MGWRWKWGVGTGAMVVGLFHGREIKLSLWNPRVQPGPSGWTYREHVATDDEESL